MLIDFQNSFTASLTEDLTVCQTLPREILSPVDNADAIQVSTVELSRVGVGRPTEFTTSSLQLPTDSVDSLETDC